MVGDETEVGASVKQTGMHPIQLVALTSSRLGESTDDMLSTAATREARRCDMTLPPLGFSTRAHESLQCQ